MSHKSIPFSAADRSTIRSTAVWMAISGGILVVCGGVRLVQPAQIAAAIGALAFDLLLWPMLGSAAQAVLGALLLLGSRAFFAVAGTGRIAALNRGFSALTVIYVFQAIALLIMLGLFVLAFMMPMFR